MDERVPLFGDKDEQPEVKKRRQLDDRKPARSKRSARAQPLVSYFASIQLRGWQVHMEQQNPLVLLCTVATLLSLFVSIFRCLCGSRSKKRRLASSTLRDRADTQSTTAARSTARSTARSAPAVDDQFGAVTSVVEEFGRGSGPKVGSIKYETWTPPTSWKNASKQLLPSNTKMKAKVRLELNLEQGELRIADMGKVDLIDVNIHVLNRQGAVLELILIGGSTNKSEYTFQSAHAAAQFQFDVNAYQTFGRTIMDQFDVLELVHRGSLGHSGKESVLHDCAGDEFVVDSGVAWDDAFRCLSSILPNIDKIWTNSRVPEEEGVDSLGLFYQNKRALMGREDFFRLYCPLLSPESMPREESSPDRLERMIMLRKQVARAALSVQSYCKARCVVNSGWKLEWDLDAKPRLAFDESVENTKHDIGAKDEYWEARVGREVHCDVHSKAHLVKPGSTVPSALQAYSLVGCHTFRLAPEDFDHWLASDRDPLESIASLRQIVQRNPDLHFFVVAFFVSAARVATIQLFVRTLPSGVDRPFDKVMAKYITGTEEVRKQKLEVFFTLGSESGLSPFTWAGIKAVSLLYRWSRKGERQIPSGATRRDTKFPGMTLDSYFETHHFGGLSQVNRGLPTNYVAATIRVDSSRMRNSLFGVLIKQLEEGALKSSIVDMTFVLEGHEVEELPERALGTIRMVHCDPTRHALPIELSAQGEKYEEDDLPRLTGMPKPEHYHFPLSPAVIHAVEETGKAFHYVGHVAAAPFVPPCRYLEDDPPPEDSFRDAIDDSFDLRMPAEDDEFKSGIDTLHDVLRDIQVPIRRVGLIARQLERATEITDEEELAALPKRFRQEGIVKLPVLELINRYDLRRFFLGSNCKVKKAAKNIVESTIWHGVTFPMDTRSFRIELQSGQFFQQGEDYAGNAVFYFRNMLAGPWKKDPKAVFNAVLHRLETSLRRLSIRKPNVKITLVVLMGKPSFAKTRKKKKKGAASMADAQSTRLSLAASGGDDQSGDDEGVELELHEEEQDVPMEISDDPYKLGVNPRLQPDTDYYEHMNVDLILQLFQTVMKHYPERLYKAIICPGKKRGYGRWGTAVGVQIALRKHIESPRTRTKCFILHRIGELKEFVPSSELITIAGGEAPIRKGVFECR